MKSFIAIPSAILATLNLVAAVPAPTAETVSVSVSYDTVYDVAGSSTNTVACGSVLNQKYPTFGSLPGFPHIGGAPTISGNGSPNCGKCYQLHFSGNGVDKNITVLGIDTGTSGFNIGLRAMNDLTDGQAEQLGRVSATQTEVDISQCA
ncbi:Allergen Asp f 15 [Penicillium rolfsii]|nr:Allergen Asp f 15 [Penicillium rolfsii]